MVLILTLINGPMDMITCTFAESIICIFDWALLLELDTCYFYLIILFYLVTLLFRVNIPTVFETQCITKQLRKLHHSMEAPQCKWSRQDDNEWSRRYTTSSMSSNGRCIVWRLGCRSSTGWRCGAIVRHGDIRVTRGSESYRQDVATWTLRAHLPSSKVWYFSKSCKFRTLRSSKS
jgi:hypothetical protein